MSIVKCFRSLRAFLRPSPTIGHPVVAFVAIFGRIFKFIISELANLESIYVPNLNIFNTYLSHIDSTFPTPIDEFWLGAVCFVVLLLLVALVTVFILRHDHVRAEELLDHAIRWAENYVAEEWGAELENYDLIYHELDISTQKIISELCTKSISDKTYVYIAAVLDLHFNIKNSVYAGIFNQQSIDTRRGFHPPIHTGKGDDASTVERRYGIEHMELEVVSNWITVAHSMSRSQIQVCPFKAIDGTFLSLGDLYYRDQPEIPINWRSVEELISVCTMHKKDADNYVSMMQYAASPNLQIPLPFKDYHFMLAVELYRLIYRQSIASWKVISNKEDKLKD